MKKILKFVILTLVFGLPVSWYLFLQTFGQNQFELFPIGKFNEICELESNTLYILDTAVINDQKLQLQRLVIELNNNNLSHKYYFDNKNCFGDLVFYPLILVGDNRDIIGNYKLNIEGVDRALVEFDLLNQL